MRKACSTQSLYSPGVRRPDHVGAAQDQRLAVTPALGRGTGRQTRCQFTLLGFHLVEKPEEPTTSLDPHWGRAAGRRSLHQLLEALLARLAAVDVDRHDRSLTWNLRKNALGSPHAVTPTLGRAPAGRGDGRGLAHGRRPRGRARVPRVLLPAFEELERLLPPEERRVSRRAARGGASRGGAPPREAVERTCAGSTPWTRGERVHHGASGGGPRRGRRARARRASGGRSGACRSPSRT